MFTYAIRPCCIKQDCHQITSILRTHTKDLKAQMPKLIKTHNIIYQVLMLVQKIATIANEHTSDSLRFNSHHRTGHSSCTEDKKGNFQCWTLISIFVTNTKCRDNCH